MAAKKAPAKKTPPPNRTDKKGASGMGKTQINVPKRIERTDKSGSSGMGKTKPNAKRTDRTGASGFGMSKRGVEDRAIDASSRSYLSNFVSGGGITGEYSNLLTEAIVKDQKNKKSQNQLDREALRAGNAVRKRYGVTPKKKK
jgi:hypothetical protein